MKTAICCIAKCENNYLKEWVDYHLTLGFSHIFINDNNDSDGEQINPLFDSYDNVTVIDCRGKKAYQNKAYNAFYQNYGSQFDWIAFIDVDEFITFAENSGLKTINEFLCRFDKQVDIVHLNWMCYGDNDIVELTNYNVSDRFLMPLDYDKCVKFDFPENNHVKSIYRGGLNVNEMNIGPHTCESGKFSYVDATGRKCDGSCFNPYDFTVAYVRHYVTKSIVEWIVKQSRGRVSVYSTSGYYSFDRFFLYNKRTPEKERVIALYTLFKDAIYQSIGTDVAILKNRLDYTERQLEKVSRNYGVVLHSKAYKIGKILTRPFSIMRVGKGSKNK